MTIPERFTYRCQLCPFELHIAMPTPAVRRRLTVELGSQDAADDYLVRQAEADVRPAQRAHQILEHPEQASRKANR
ncbi:MAG: hypothetical protein JWR88_1041 [Pseudonocardia sp.]|nr:hypothetical protein [Pseudonocardia sp.]